MRNKLDKYGLCPLVIQYSHAVLCSAALQYSTVMQYCRVPSCRALTRGRARTGSGVRRLFDPLGRGQWKTGKIVTLVHVTDGKHHPQWGLRGRGCSGGRGHGGDEEGAAEASHQDGGGAGQGGGIRDDRRIDGHFTLQETIFEAFTDKAIRIGFIRKVYGLVTIQVRLPQMILLYFDAPISDYSLPSPPGCWLSSCSTWPRQNVAMMPADGVKKSK